jgi:2-amino-4-hydroxy-6-hydroxymethyldihydropteridine diphosphokinase
VDAHGTPQVVTAYVAIGANLGDARQTVLRALDALARLPSSQLTARSDLYRTAPHQAQGPDFVNAVARMATGLMALDLLDALQALESEAGRLRPYLNAPRTLDLDLLFYGDAQMHSPRLTLPHPRWPLCSTPWPMCGLSGSHPKTCAVLLGKVSSVCPSLHPERAWPVWPPYHLDLTTLT